MPTSSTEFRADELEVSVLLETSLTVAIALLVAELVKLSVPLPLAGSLDVDTSTLEEEFLRSSTADETLTSENDGNAVNDAEDDNVTDAVRLATLV